MVKQLPMRIRSAHPSDVRSQFGALCYRVEQGKVKVLLITSRNTGRWVIPKGWPVDGCTPAESAAREAWEEAGVTGKVQERCLGIYSYAKTHGPVVGLPCVVMVYPLLVQSLASDFPERDQRRVKWFSPKKAAARVMEPELARMLRDFDPDRLH